LNQAAVYSTENKRDAVKNGLIPYDLGFAVSLNNAQHKKLHESLEKWWNQYREDGPRFGTRPTNAEYGMAHLQAMLDAGLCAPHANLLFFLGLNERKLYGLQEFDPVPLIPKKIPPIFFNRKK
jgi:hypothetical protein